ncbi:VanW family protein [Natranaerobius trueperi]|uniref:YoaR-like putative peptidoglycan binding domain-containing protein n=1 Tax=Natranaerobius trueperi TaxID=759412 RepID=A0A226C105_9FIRM|nr:VanW family protein [Natranaerobius trueperi]OWZ84284.1 hypothetical protein CDO51_04290 [Natranaerobius trueperi]
MSGKNPFKKPSILLILVLLVFVIIQVNFDVIDMVKRYFYGVEKNVIIEGYNIERWYEHEVKDLVEKSADEKDQPYKNAKLDPETGEIQPEKQGRKVLVNKTVKKIMESPSDTEQELIYMPLYPQITEEMLKSIYKPIGEFSTGLLDNHEGRNTNIELATKDINNTIVFPGQIFSFNQETLPRTWERGYRFAPIIVGNAVVDGIGGGVCQVSSTLYNAVLNADLEVIERHPHGEPVDYVPPGRDATIAGDYLDLKFKNNTKNLVLITGDVTGGIVNISIYASDEPLAFQLYK